MAGIVAFDQKGVFGPALTLIYRADSYSEKGLSEIAKLLQKNFATLTNEKPKGRKEFCAFVSEKIKSNQVVTAVDIIGTQFFQNMINQNVSAEDHAKVLQVLIPRMMSSVVCYFPEVQEETDLNKQIYQWFAQFVERYISPERLAKSCEAISSVDQNLSEERAKIGKELYETTTTQDFDEKDLNGLVKVCQDSLKSTTELTHPNTVLNFTAKYLGLFAKDGNPLQYGDEVLTMINTLFRQKFFNKEDVNAASSK